MSRTPCPETTRIHPLLADRFTPASAFASADQPLAYYEARRLDEAPRWSADGRYVDARISAAGPSKATLAAVVIADASGKPLGLLRSRYVISMFA